MNAISNLYEEYLVAVTLAHRSGGIASPTDHATVSQLETLICTMLANAGGKLSDGDMSWKLEVVEMDGSIKGARLLFRYFVVLTERTSPQLPSFTFPRERPRPGDVVKLGGIYERKSHVDAQ